MRTEEEAKELLETLGKLQKDECADRPCPRCGKYRMAPKPTHNALSRRAAVYICDQCGVEEALLDMAGQPPLPLSWWSAVRSFGADRK